MSREIVFVCTNDGCGAGPWEDSDDAMAHCAEQRGHAYAGTPRAELDSKPFPASTTEYRDTRNLQQKGDPKSALGGDS